MLVALLGQLAMLAHGALVAHVTCGADGELIHVKAGTAAPASARDAVRAALDDGGDAHDHCLLDEDGEALCPTIHVASDERAPASRADHLVRRRERVARPHAPLYRLAPKNSPPA
jgi:hypothetical protein